MSNRSKKLILAVVAVVLTLAVGEVALRLVGFGQITPEMNFGVNTTMALEQGRFLPDRDLFWKIPPLPRDADIRAIQPDRPIPAKGPRRRILVLGDSCSRLSQQLPPFSALLEDTLGRGHEVWNAAVPGYTVWQGRAWLHRQLLAAGFDAAVVYFGWNDHWRATGATDADYARRQSGSSLRLASLFARTASPPPLRLPPDDYRRTLEALVRDLQAAKVRVILVAAPANLTREAQARLVQTRYLMAGDDAVALHRQYLGILREVAAATGAELLNAVGIFAAQPDPGVLLMRDGIHLTDLGHRAMASVLAPVLASETGGTVPDTATLARRARALVDGKAPTPTGDRP